jgi:hypothetical protein
MFPKEKRRFRPIILRRNVGQKRISPLNGFLLNKKLSRDFPGGTQSGAGSSEPPGLPAFMSLVIGLDLPTR